MPLLLGFIIEQLSHLCNCTVFPDQFSPEDGYIFYVTRSDGKEKVLKPERNWSLWYSMEDETWYYRKIKDKNEIDISTLRVEKK